MVYCYIITIWDLGSDFSQASMWWIMMPLLSITSPCLILCSRSPEQQRAWQEKMGLILTLMAGVGFTEAVYGTLATRFRGAPSSCCSVLSMPIVIRSYSYDLTNFSPPASMGFDGNTNPITTVRILLETVPLP